MTWQLLPGLRLVRRDAGQLQLGIDPPLAAVLPDRVPVRRLVRDLAAGRPLPTLDDELGAALATIVRAGLVVPAEEPASARAHRDGALVHLDLPAPLLPAALRLVDDAGMHAVVGADPRPVTAALVWGEGEVARERVDAWSRSGTPHLVVTERADGTWLGPYVVPDRTACLRCVDAHRGELDPRRPLVVAQVADLPPLVPAADDPVLRSLTLAWAVRDLALAAQGARPATWSALVRVDLPAPHVTAYSRHPHCGCAWGDALRRAPGALTRAADVTAETPGVARAG